MLCPSCVIIARIIPLRPDPACLVVCGAPVGCAAPRRRGSGAAEIERPRSRLTRYRRAALLNQSSRPSLDEVFRRRAPLRVTALEDSSTATVVGQQQARSIRLAGHSPCACSERSGGAGRGGLWPSGSATGGGLRPGGAPSRASARSAAATRRLLSRAVYTQAFYALKAGSYSRRSRAQVLPGNLSAMRWRRSPVLAGKAYYVNTINEARPLRSARCQKWPDSPRRPSAAEARLHSICP